LVEVSSTPPSKPLSKAKRCQKVSVALEVTAGIGIGTFSVSRWSEMVFMSGAKAERVPVWDAVVTDDQPGAPVELKLPSVPLSKPSDRTLTATPHGVAVAVAVAIGVAVAVAVAVGVAVAVAVAIGDAVGIGVWDWFGVGVGVPPIWQPRIWNIWSGAAGSIPQVAPLLP